MTVDQSLISMAPENAAISSRCGFPSAEDIEEAAGGEAGDDAETVPGSLRAPPAFPAWPRIYPGL